MYGGIALNSSNILTLYHMKTCGHCIKMRPEWEKIEKMAKDGVLNFTVRSHEASEPGVPSFIEGYPTIVLHNNMFTNVYSGGRTADEIIKWATENSK